MPGDDPTDKIIEELAKQIPVKEAYGDLASPAAKEVGQTLADIIKVLKLALIPVQYLAALQDRYRSFLDQSVRRVQADRLISPAPQILGPVLEAIKYEPEGTPLDQAFSQLLSAAMDRDRVDIAHPAFPGIVRQLSSDEAKILALISKAKFRFIVLLHYNSALHRFEGRTVELDEFPCDGLSFPKNIFVYMDHLDQLGLAWLQQIGNQEPVYDPITKLQTGSRQLCEYQLKDWGRLFVSACMP